MSAEITDVGRIQDEDILRRMWQETDDFGKKKEIRSHMYKLREARLKEFYNSSEGHTVIQQTTTSSNSDNSIKSNMSTHADNLADQSYVTLKSKEVRDSESPTRDSYNKTIAKHQDQGWTVTSSNERSQDGKTHVSTHEASTSGTQQIDKGKVDYNAKLQEKAAVFQDGDDKNFTRAVETSSNSAICQEATGGDENSSFRSSTSKTSSSSRYHSESKHTNEDIQALPPTTTVIREQIPQSVINEENVKSVTERTFTSKVPYELKNHPSYVEGKTKVTQETKTLSDGTIVTTTKYETKQGNSTQTATHKKYSNIASNRSEQRSSSSSTHEQSSRAVKSDSRHSARDNQRAIEYIVVPEDTINVDNTDTKSQHKDYWDTKKRESITRHETSRNIKDSALNEQVTRRSNITSREMINDNVDYTDVILNPVTQNVTTTKTTVTKKSVPEKIEYVAIIPVPVDQDFTTTTTTETTGTEHPRKHTDVTYHTTATHVVDRKHDTRDTKQLINDQFISTERRHEIDTRESVTKPQQPYQEPLQPATKPIETQEIYTPTYSEPKKHPEPTQESYSQPDRRQPIKPPKSDLDQKSQPTEGQYDTTYRSEFTNKKISVEVSPTHDAFARSLRAVTPERITKSFPRNSSNSSLRGSPSPEKSRHPSRTSPDRRDRSMSPKKSTDKFSSTETITYNTNRTSPVRYLDQKPVNGDTNIRTTKTRQYDTDTFTRKSKNVTTKTDTVDSNILPRKNKPRSPSPSETVTSDFEFVRNAIDISDLDTSRIERTTVNKKETTRPSSLEITRKVKKVTERSPTSPLTDIISPRKSPTKEMPKKDRSPTKDSNTDRPKLIRTDTYEERVKQILGLANDTKETRRTSLERHSSFERRRSSLEKNTFKRSSLRETNKRTSSDDIKFRKSSPSKSPEKNYPEKQSPVKDLFSPTKPGARISEFPSQIRKSPEKNPLESYPSRKSPTKTTSSISEFPSQIRKSQEKEPLGPYPEKKSPKKTVTTTSEFPSQIKRTPEKETLEPYPEKKSPTKTAPTISEFPSQIKKSQEKQPLEPYPEKKSPTKSSPTISEFPSQVKKSPKIESLEPYPERKSPTKTVPTVSEFPSQIRRTPEREPLEPYPESKLPTAATTVSEFPSQIRRTPEREPLEPYPERKSPTKTISTVSEFPSQITKKLQEKEPLQPYPERNYPTKTAPTISEFPSQIRRTPEREYLEPYPERKSPTKTVPSISEFPSQVRRSPEKEPSEPFPGKTSTKPSSKQAKKKSSRKPKTSSESSTTTEEENDQIEETITQTTIETMESKVPISEPIAEKKIFSQLCREDEVKRLDKKKTTKELLESEILHNQINEQQTPKKHGAIPVISKSGTKRTTNVTDVVQTGATINKTSSIKTDRSPYKGPIEKTSLKKNIETSTYTKTRGVNKINIKDSSRPTYKPTTPTNKKQSEKIYKVEKTKFIGETEYQDKFTQAIKIKKEPVKTTFRPKSKTTLHDVEKFENVKDTTVHVRTNRVDDTVTKKKVSKTILLNGDETKTKSKMLPVRQTSPIKKSPVSVTVKPSNQAPDTTPKSNLSTQSRYSSTIKQKVIQNDNKPKQNKPTGIKKHVVTATINVSPKTRPAVKTTGSKTVTTTRTTTSRTKEVPKKVVNGYVSSDDDEDSVVESVEGSFVDLTEKRNQFTFKSTSNEPSQMFSELEDLDKDRKTRRQVITTKTVLITNEDVPDREVIVNLQRSKSSREPTPDRLCPRPLTSDEEEDTAPARYPDQISEPDEGSLKRKPKKLSDIPIFETEDYGDHSRITEITEKKKNISKVDRVEETDESLLSISKKINKFLNTADQLTKEPLKPKSTKVERQIFEVSDELKEDECLLSVSDKVSKFINTSEQLAASKLPDRPKSPRPKTFDEGLNVNIQKKVTQFKTSVEEANKPKKVSPDPAPKMPRPDLTDVDEKLKEDECLLSVSDKVSKFISTAEKLTSTSSSKPVNLCNIDVKPKNYKDSPTPEVRTPVKLSILKTDHKTTNKDLTSDFIHIEKQEEVLTRRSTSLSPERRRSPSPEFKTPTRRPSNQYSTVQNTENVKTQTTSHEVISTDLSPKSKHQKQPHDVSTVLSSTSKFRSTGSIKKAKALFEKVEDNQDTPRQRDILSRPSVFEGKRTSRADKQEIINKSSIQKTTDDNLKTTKLVETISRRSQSPQKSPDQYTTSEKERKQEIKSSIQKLTDDNLKTIKLVETISRRSQSPQKSPERYTSTEKVEITRFRASSPEKIPEIVKPRSREPSPQGDMPHYMKPLDRSLRPNSPHRDSITPTQQTPPSEQEDTRPTKFGVTLRRTDSGRTSKTIESSSLTAERRKSSITLEKRITEEEIEEIFELDVLEELLEKIIGYDLRRKIRTQIRLVKKLISENTLEEYIIKRKYLPREPITRRGSSPSKTSKPDKLNKTEYETSYTRKVSPERTTIDKKLFEHTDVVDRRSSYDKTTESKSSYSFNERRSSTECTKLTRKSPSPVREPKSPLRLSPERNVSRKVDITPTGKVTTVKTTEVTPGGVKTTTTKTTESKTFTTLKRTAPSSKKHVEDTQPEWVRQRNLKNIRDNTVQTSKKVSSSATTTRKSSVRTSPAKEVKGTDIITSSYGVGPTDENGAPLFGLKALRAQNGHDKTKVQGTVIRSQYYSENDREPVGEVSVTKYSTDPTDLKQDGVIHSDGKITSVTTTQKFGYKHTPSLRTLTDNKKEICDTSETLTTKSTKLNRRGSVKEISKKFIDNAVETLKSERQTTYPKAGLILRTSSFKSSNGEPHSRETSPDEDRETESRETVTIRTMKTSKGGETFLTNTSKVSGVQDVITRMKTEEYEEGDTEEDIAARGLLNRFIGSQVILSGMEERASSARSKTTESISPSGTVRRSTTVTTTVTEGGKPTTTTRVFQRPVTEREIETVWDEQTLRLLLEQSTDYEERRVIRARLRQLMAEQEACTALVDDATKSEGSTTPTTPTTPGHLEGESQLLPLLQGLLAAPENDITPDSGTESGEDQRTNLIAEVQGALEKLSNSLRSDQTDITPERRSSLLQLVTKLQAGLSGSNTTERRASAISSSGRFQKRKNKQARHTVGVSKEELADARKLIEQISLNDLTPSSSISKVQLSKQNSESSVPTSSASSSYRNINQAKVKNTTPKPFSSSNSTASSVVQTPTDHFDGFDVLFGEDKDKDKEVTIHEAVSVQQKATPAYAKTVKQSKSKMEKTPKVDSDVKIKSAYKAVQQAAAIKRELSREQKDDESQSEEDESNTVKGASDLENASLKSNPIYSKPFNVNLGNEEKSSRFDTQKKLRMKRANTIDIPKPLKYYQDDDESDSEHENDAQSRKDKYYALRGPINVGNPNTKKIVPSFVPKTDSDRKFLAFINNRQEHDENKSPMWSKNSTVWGSRFGNIKNTFEAQPVNDAKRFWKSADDSLTKSSANQFGPKISRRSARNLQQMFEEKQKETQKSVSVPKQATVNVKKGNHEKNLGHLQSNVVTGSLQVKTGPEKNYKVVPQPLPVNQFSHAPQSAFKPIQKVPQSPSKRASLVFSPDGEILKTEIKSTNGPAFLYSPKPLSSPVETVASPVGSKPWAANTGGSRVLSLAASKFEQPVQHESPKPRKLSKDAGPKVFIPTNQVSPINRKPSYLAKSAENTSGTVRKLSGQYENVDNNTGGYQPPIESKPLSYQVKTSVVESQYTPPVKHYEPPVRPSVQSIPVQPVQNYSIRYDQPQQEPLHYNQQPNLAQEQQTFSKQYMSTQQPQNYSIRYDQPQIPQSQIYQQPTSPNYTTKYDQPRIPPPQQQINQQYDQPRIPPPQQQLNQQYQPHNYSIRYDQQTQNQPPSPQNYSIRYDQPQTNLGHPQSPQLKAQNYTVRYDQPQTPPVAKSNQIYQHIPGKEQSPQMLRQNSLQHKSPSHDSDYTSTFEFKPAQSKVPVQAIEPVVQPPKVQRQISEESVHEHIAVSSRVMSGPVSQQAVTVRQKSPMNRNEHDMEAAFGLKSSLQKVNESSQKARSPSNSFSYKPRESAAVSPSLSQSFKSKTGLPTFDPIKYKPSDCPKPTVAPSSYKFKSTFEDTQKEQKNCGVVKPMQNATPIFNNVSKPKEKLHINNMGQSVVTGQFHIPLINVKSPTSPRPPTQSQVLSKSDSWHEICVAHQVTAQKPVPKPGPVKSKSSHSLAVPKLFEAGMSKDEMLQKRKTMEAFLVGNKSPTNEEGAKTVKRSINRVKTSQKVSTQKRMTGGLCRSRTLPDIICPELLDESNIDEAFDELFQTS